MALTLLFGLIQGAGLEKPREGVPNLEYPRSPRKQNSTFFPVVRPGFLSAQNGVRKAPAGLIDPISGKDVSGLHFYDLALSTKLADYRGRLTIDWALDIARRFSWRTCTRRASIWRRVRRFGGLRR